MDKQAELVFENDRDFLATAYRELGYTEGALLDPADRPTGEDDPHWLEKGDWLVLAKSAGAEKVFFVDHNPVIIFAKTVDQTFPALKRLYNRIWSMCRPRLLFIEMPGELSVYDLAKSPVRHLTDLGHAERCLERVRSVAEVKSALQKYRREEIESGRVFGDERFESLDCRADKSLIQDLKTVRSQLLDSGLAPKFAHALIGRAIFLRYLEDRVILAKDYFENIAAGNSKWKRLLATPTDKLDVDQDLDGLLFPRVLGDKEFTYALFEQLAIDFHGDMFPFSAEEKDAVTPEQLRLLQGFLRGETHAQLQLFFFAYKFDIIPIELISSIYEEFYNDEHGKEKNQGSHYTPSALVEFLLNQTLTPDVLRKSPRILDPACGSGIFLVESYRRIVRFKTQEFGRRLHQGQLKKILREQITGIDINEEAIRVAAFSLYLALLHYQDPREINEERRLPNLKWEKGRPCDERNHYDILVHANTFTFTPDRLDEAICVKFGSRTFDVVVGNPPWGAPPDEDLKGRAEAAQAYAWCEQNKLPVGDKELSQAFIHRVTGLLKPNGHAALLVSSGILWKEHAQSVAFRRIWLQSTRLVRIVNFAHVRRIFFTGPMREAEGVAPFVAVHFVNEVVREPSAYFEYWSAKRTTLVSQLQVAVLDKTDLRVLDQMRCLRNDKLWKIYWWGNHHDESLIRALQSHARLATVADESGALLVASGSGFKESGGSSDKPKNWKGDLRELPTRIVKSYGRLDADCLKPPPPQVARLRDPELFQGRRIIAKQCPSGKAGEVKRIVARYETQAFCYRHSIYALKFRHDLDWEIKIVLGILWSSLARYYFFLTASQWGSWYDKLSLDDLRGLPVRLPRSKRMRERIVKCVDRLRNWKAGDNTMSREGVLDDPAAIAKQVALERELDRAVFALFELNSAERDLVWDMCNVGLDLYYRHTKSHAFTAQTLPDLSLCNGTIQSAKKINSEVGRYLVTFLESWNEEFKPDQEFIYQVIANTHKTMVALVFSLADKPAEPTPERQHDSWSSLLNDISKTSLAPWLSSRIYIDGSARITSPHEIVIIKRNEMRFWTQSVAREDAEAALVQVLNSDSAHG